MTDIVTEITVADIPGIIHLAARMHEESIYSAFDFNPQKVADRCWQIIESESMIGMVATRYGKAIGMMGGYVVPYEYGEGLVASDILVYVSPEYRGSRAFIRMVRMYAEWAKSKGASFIFLNQTSGISPDLTSELYQRLGLVVCGSNHVMEVRQ